MLLSLLYYYDQTSATLVRKRDIFIKNKKKTLGIGTTKHSNGSVE